MILWYLDDESNGREQKSKPRKQCRMKQGWNLNRTPQPTITTKPLWSLLFFLLNRILWGENKRFVCVKIRERNRMLRRVNGKNAFNILGKDIFGLRKCKSREYWWYLCLTLVLILVFHVGPNCEYITHYIVVFFFIKP